MKYKTKSVGDKGEDEAARFLAEMGYEIIGRNYRKRGGEIDIIAKDGETLVFVEVKNLPNGNAETLSHVLNARKQSRIIYMAKQFLLEYPEYENAYIRFDVIALNIPSFPKLYHIKNAFMET